MKYNLLKMVQLILSSMDSEEVDGIFDTVESRQIVDLIEQSYNDILSVIEYASHYDLFELEPSLDPTRPTLLKLPQNVVRMEWLEYNVAPTGQSVNYQRLYPLERKTFFDRMRMFDNDLTHPEVYQFLYQTDDATFDVRGRNNTSPKYYTTVDNRTLLVDDYDSDLGSTIVGGRTKAYGLLYPMFVRDDEFVADLEPREFSLFFNEAKSLCFAELKQVPNQKAEQRARRGWVHSQKKKENTKASAVRRWLPNYGR